MPRRSETCSPFMELDRYEFLFFLIVFSNRFPVWLMKPEVNWQGNCDQVICITQQDTLNYWSWFVIRLTVSTMRNAASICLSRLRKVPLSCTAKMNDGSNVIMKITQENICRVRSRNEIEAWNVSEDCEALPKKRNAMLLRGKTMNRTLHLLSDKSREFDSLNYVWAQRSNFVTRSLINYVTSSESTYVTLSSNCVWDKRKPCPTCVQILGTFHRLTELRQAWINH